MYAAESGGKIGGTKNPRFCVQQCSVQCSPQQKRPLTNGVSTSFQNAGTGHGEWEGDALFMIVIQMRASDHGLERRGVRPGRGSKFCGLQRTVESGVRITANKRDADVDGCW